MNFVDEASLLFLIFIYFFFLYLPALLRLFFACAFVQIKRRYPNAVHVRCEAEVNDKIARLVSDGPDKLQVNNRAKFILFN